MFAVVFLLMEIMMCDMMVLLIRCDAMYAIIMLEQCIVVIQPNYRGWAGGIMSYWD